MVYIVANPIGGTKNVCIGVCDSIQDARKMSMKYIGKSRVKSTHIYKVSKETIKYYGISKGKSFDFGFSKFSDEEIFLPRSPERYVIILGKWPYNEYFLDSNGSLVGKATDSRGTRKYILAKTQI